MNDVYLLEGINTPWSFKEIDTTLGFSDHAAHIFFEIKRDVA
jgi:hypothetical protein